jgi:uncharacterized protein DUF6152
MIRSIAVVGIVVASAVVASAHHGFGTFDLTKSVTYTGKLTRLEFINPHSWLYFEVTDANGKVTKHRCEMRSAHTLRRSGWKEELFPIGQQVTVEAAPDRADPQSCYLNTIRFANGTHMDRYGQYVATGKNKVEEVRGPLARRGGANTGGGAPAAAAPRAARRASGEPNISGDWAPEQVVMADPRGRGGALVPLSRIATETPAEGGAARAGGGRGGGGRGRGPAGPRTYAGTEVTPAGDEAAAKFTQKDNPRFMCQTTNIIFDWTFDGPVNRIQQNRDNIVIFYGQLNLRRTIHTNTKTHPANVTPSRAGHSYGYWEGDTLVVDTTNFLPGFLNFPIPNSDKLHVVERFTLDPQTMKLTRSYTVEDPVYLKGQGKGQDVVEPADQPYTRDSCKDQQFVDYSKEAAAR